MAEITADSDDDPVEMTCHACGYEWTYTGALKFATCPSCQSKTEVRRDG